MNYVQFHEGFNYDPKKAPEAQSEDIFKINIDSVLEKYKFNSELTEELKLDIEEYIQDETKNATLEFISRFFERMGKGGKTAYAVARALGFAIWMEDKDGNKISSLKDIAKHWNVCPQMIDQLTKQIQKDLEIDPIENLAIHKKNYSYQVEAPKGYMTTGQVIKFLNISNKKLNGIIKLLNIKKKSFCRGSKLIAESDIDKIELYLMDGVDES